VLNYNPLNRLDIAWIAKYVGKQFIDNTSNESRKLDPYFVNDLRINYSITTGFITEIDFSLLINNILNAQYSSNAWVYRYFEDGREYRMDGFFPQAGINVLGGVTLKF
jgi:iron complex outermembrane receptor protein